MKHDHAPAVAAHFLTCSALALAASAAPFVPEGIAVYAGVLYLRHFLYSVRQWQAPARVPLYLGRRGYRDATLQRRGAATWPVGTTVVDRQQVWLMRSDFAEGCAIVSDDTAWRDAVIEQLVLGTCLHEMGAIVVQDHTTPSLHGRLSAIAEPFGRRGEIAAVDLDDPLTKPLRISETAIEAALKARGASPSTLALNNALIPVRALLARRTGEDPLFHFAPLSRSDAIDALAAGHGEQVGLSLDDDDTRPSDASVLLDISRILKAMPSIELNKACRELAPFAHELSAVSGLSLRDGIDLQDAILTRRITTVRHNSPLTAAIVSACCAEALAALRGKNLEHTLLHLPCDPLAAPDEALDLLASAVKLGALATIALPDSATAPQLTPVYEKCRMRLSHEPGYCEGYATFVLEYNGELVRLDLMLLERGD